jgi:hypothetical protein
MGHCKSVPGVLLGVIICAGSFIVYKSVPGVLLGMTICAVCFIE